MHLHKYNPAHTFKHAHMHGHTQSGHGLLLIFPILECFFGRLSCTAAVCGLAAQTHQSFTKKLTRLSFIAILGVDSLHCHTNEGFPYFNTIFLPFCLFMHAGVSVFEPSFTLVIIIIINIFFATQRNVIICFKSMVQLQQQQLLGNTTTSKQLQKLGR